MESTSGLPPSGGRDGGGGPDKRQGKKATKPREFMRGKPKKQWSVDEKKKIIKMIEDGARTCEIVKVMGVPESSVRNIRKKKDEIKASLKVTEKYFSGGAGAAKRTMHDTSVKNRNLVITEHYLMKYICRRLKEGVSVDGPEIRVQAMKIYKALCV